MLGFKTEKQDFIIIMAAGSESKSKIFTLYGIFEDDDGYQTRQFTAENRMSLYLRAKLFIKGIFSDLAEVH